MENLGRVQADVHPRLAGPAALRAKLVLRDQFGDLAEARDVLARLVAALDDLGQPEPAPNDTPQHEATPTGRRRNERKEEHMASIRQKPTRQDGRPAVTERGGQEG